MSLAKHAAMVTRKWKPSNVRHAVAKTIGGLGLALPMAGGLGTAMTAGPKGPSMRDMTHHARQAAVSVPATWGAEAALLAGIGRKRRKATGV